MRSTRSILRPFVCAQDIAHYWFIGGKDNDRLKWPDAAHQIFAIDKVEPHFNREPPVTSNS
jgi:hypothetical protein